MGRGLHILPIRRKTIPTSRDRGNSTRGTGRTQRLRVIGQKELVKTAVVVENSTATAVISFFKEDTGWTKRVGKIAGNP